MIEIGAKQSGHHDVLIWMGRMLIVGGGYPMAIMFGSAILSVTGLPLPTMPGGIEWAASLLVNVLSGVLLGVVLARISERLSIPFYQRAGVLIVLVFTLNNLVNFIEGIFFTTVPPIERLSGLLVVGIGHAVIAVLVAWFSPHQIALINLSNVLLETGRGLLFVLTLLVGVAVLRTPRRLTVLWLWLIISMLGAWVPTLQATWLPLMLRVVQGLEISGDALLQSITLAWLFGYQVERK